MGPKGVPDTKTNRPPQKDNRVGRVPPVWLHYHMLPCTVIWCCFVLCRSAPEAPRDRRRCFCAHRPLSNRRREPSISYWNYWPQAILCFLCCACSLVDKNGAPLVKNAEGRLYRSCAPTTSHDSSVGIATACLHCFRPPAKIRNVSLLLYNTKFN
jgi:hypothetical protein